MQLWIYYWTMNCSFFRKLEFLLKDIKEIITSPDFDKSEALEQQIELLILKREHLDNLILMAREIKMLGAFL